MKTTLEISRIVNQTDLEFKVKNMYREVALHPDQEFHFKMGEDMAVSLGYPSQLLIKIPKASVESFAGVGYYFGLANLQQGETVVDLGSGSGMDAFAASIMVGESGQVTGIDMTDEQLAKAKKLRAAYHFDNVNFLKGYIEDLPVQSGSTEVVISNGVINLSADKQKVFEEAYRILSPGGRMVISDIVSAVQLPENITCNATLWAACIGGALQRDTYFEYIRKAGFRIEATSVNDYEFISKNARNAGEKYGIQSISILAYK